MLNLLKTIKHGKQIKLWTCRVRHNCQVSIKCDQINKKAKILKCEQTTFIGVQYVLHCSEHNIGYPVT